MAFWTAGGLESNAWQERERERDKVVFFNDKRKLCRNLPLLGGKLDFRRQGRGGRLGCRLLSNGKSSAINQVLKRKKLGMRSGGKEG